MGLNEIGRLGEELTTTISHLTQIIDRYTYIYPLRDLDTSS